MVILSLADTTFATKSKFTYNINHPSIEISLPDVLKEVSGITWLEGNTLACIQDENGKVFIYNTDLKTITHSYTFGNKGDYEGIAIAGKVLYVMRSDGVLYEIINYQSSQKVENSYTLNIPSPNCEGICYDKVNNRILIASKGKPTDLDEKQAKGVRHIYCFDLRTKTLCNEPFIEISLPAIQQFMKLHNISLPPRITKDGKEKERSVKLRSSEIAIQPETRDIYILSAIEHLLYIFAQNGTIKNVILLDKTIYPKAEGISFSSEGDMYITNEAESLPASLLVIEPEKK